MGLVALVVWAALSHPSSPNTTRHNTAARHHSPPQAQVQRLQEMAGRNKGNAGLAPQIAAKLKEAQAALDAARATARAAHKSVSSQEAARRWVKF